MMVYPGLVGICGTQRTQLSSMATRVVKVHEREWEVEGGGGDGELQQLEAPSSLSGPLRTASSRPTHNFRTG